MVIKLNGFEIREWQAGDVDSLCQNADNIKIWNNVRDRFPYPYTIEDARTWLRVVESEKLKTQFAIAVDKQAIGAIGFLLKEDVYRKNAEMGYWIGENYWGRGIMTLAVKAMTEYAFRTYDLVRIFAGVFEWNTASMRVLEKAGFVLEARHKKAVYKKGCLVDELIYATYSE